MASYKRHTVEITKEHIENGKPCSKDDCAISLALRESLQSIARFYEEGSVEVSSDIDEDGAPYIWAVIRGKDEKIKPINGKYHINLEEYDWNTPNKVKRFMKEYDSMFVSQGVNKTFIKKGTAPIHCVPFSFDISIPV